jgi:putative transposase
VRNQRSDFHYKTTCDIVRRFGVIAVEDLKVAGLASSMLAKPIHDAGWRLFLRILAVIAEEAGRQLVAVGPAGTTQRCSGCGAHVPKTLKQRWHECTSCGLKLGRDENAARNILYRALNQGSGWGLQAPTVGVARAVA